MFKYRKKQKFISLGLAFLVVMLLYFVLTFLRRDGLILQATLQGHHARWVDATVNLDKTVFATAFDTYIQVVDLGTGEQSDPISGGLEEIDDLAISPNGTFLAASSHTTRLWRRSIRKDVEGKSRATDFANFTYEEIPLEEKTNQNGSPIAFDSLGEALYFLGGRAESGVPIDSIYKVDPATGQVVDIYDNELFGRVREFALSPNDTTFALTDHDNKLILFDSSTWEFRELKRSDVTDSIQNLAFSPDGTQLAASMSGGNTVVWDVMSGRELTTFISDKSAKKLEFSRDGSLLFRCVIDLVDKPVVEVWSISDNRYVVGKFAETRENCLTFLPADQDMIPRKGEDHPVSFASTTQPFLSVIAEQLGTVANNVIDLAYTSDAKHLITLGSDEILQFWDVPSGDKEKTIDLSEMTFADDFTVSPDGRWLVIQGIMETVLWNLLENKPYYELRVPNDESLVTVGFSPDGNYLAGIYSEGAIVLWQVHSGDIVKAFHIAGEPLRDLVFLQPSGRLVVLTEMGWLYQVNLVDGSSKRLFRAYTSDRAYGSDQPDATVFSEQGSLLAVAVDVESGTYGRTILVWDIEQQEKVAEFSWPYYYVNALRFSPDGALLAVSRDPFIQEGGRVEIFDISLKKRWASPLPFSGNAHYDKGALAFSSDSRTLAVGSGYDPELSTLTLLDVPPIWVRWLSLKRIED